MFVTELCRPDATEPAIIITKLLSDLHLLEFLGWTQADKLKLDDHFPISDNQITHS